MRAVEVKTNSRSQMIDITRTVQRELDGLGLDEGAVLVFVPHTTAGITINENADPTVKRDMLDHFEEAVPWNNDYQHLEGNSAAHIKASMMGSSETVMVENGQLILGRWQALYFCEFDGPRSRKVFIEPL